jgi:hypothetical protein
MALGDAPDLFQPDAGHAERTVNEAEAACPEDPDGARAELLEEEEAKRALGEARRAAEVLDVNGLGR